MHSDAISTHRFALFFWQVIFGVIGERGCADVAVQSDLANGEVGEQPRHAVTANVNQQ